MSENSAQVDSSSRRVYFSPEVDLCMLEMCVSENIFQDAKLWDNIAKILSETYTQSFSVRTCKERTSRMLKQHKKDENKSRKKSGVDEEYDKKDFLLNQLVELEREANSLKEGTKKKGKSEDDKMKGKQMREAALVSLKKKKREEENEENTPIEDEELGEGTSSSNPLSAKKRRTSSEEFTIKYLEGKNIRECQIRTEEMRMRRLEYEALKEQQALDREERKRLIELVMLRYGKDGKEHNF